MKEIGHLLKFKKSFFVISNKWEYCQQPPLQYFHFFIITFLIFISFAHCFILLFYSV